MKKLLAILLALTFLFSLAACGEEAQEKNETTAAEGEKLSFTVIVVHQDKTEKTFTYEATGKLGAFLEEEGLIESEGADEGMFHTVDGEKADYNVNKSYWALYVGDEYAMKGIYDTDIENGVTYKLVYTIG